MVDVPLNSHPAELTGSLGSKNRYFDFHNLAKVTGAVTNDLDRIIDENYYPLESARTSNLRHRPIGIGVHGLAGVFILLGMSFDSPELSAKDGAYETYKGSPMSKGILQPDMWKVTPSYRCDWPVLRDMISKNGVRNTLLVSLAGNNKGLEPYASNISNGGLRTAWEMAVVRGAYVDQSQSFDIHLDEPSRMKVTDLHFYTWFQGQSNRQNPKEIETEGHSKRQELLRDVAKKLVTREKLQEMTNERVTRVQAKVYNLLNLRVCGILSLTRFRVFLPFGFYTIELQAIVCENGSLIL
ncbi:hypothetical protein Bca52824_056530 [Brassica carinata]|uniref:Ribonucleotide reductase large subunit C-terminal domain-containing protein n=1 Tax=Brassica carinata TaxID=52824 RepID=A0A8X7UBW5_BRACI|nr:hypothetical protein Bca52824_056530 [Brassica carinata]